MGLSCWVSKGVAAHTYSFMIHAGDNTVDGRYYNKTLEEYDKISLVRDRSGTKGRDKDGEVGADEEGEEEEVEEEEEEGEDEEYEEEFAPEEEEEEADDEPGPSSRSASKVDLVPQGKKTKEQIDLENEWGLYRDQSPDGESQATKGGEREEESDTEDEEAELDWAQLDVDVSSTSLLQI